MARRNRRASNPSFTRTVIPDVSRSKHLQQDAPAGNGPRPGSPEPEAGARDGAGSGRPVVLVVEDERDFREVVALRLQQQGYTVIEAGSAGSGWEKVQQSAVQAAVLDYHLPGIDGQSLAYQLRHEFGDRLMLLAFTAWPADILDRAHLFDSIHEKPDVDALLTSLRPLRPERRTPELAVPPGFIERRRRVQPARTGAVA